MEEARRNMDSGIVKRGTFIQTLILLLIFMLYPKFSFSMPMHPELEKRLKIEGRYEEVVNILMDAKSRGVDQPNPNPPRWNLKGVKINQPAIVILVEFTDNQASTSPSHYDEMLFSVGTYSTGSMRDYYLENSYNQLDITGEVTIWLTMPHPYSWYVNGQYGFGDYPQNAQKLVEDAVIAADPYVDFSQYDADNDGYVDALFVVHAGPGAEETGDTNDIWSHMWSTSYPVPVDGVYAYIYSMEPENGRIGVFCHELGHVFGLPDLYDYGYDSRGTGFWSVMSAGSWGNGGLTPVHFDGWSKIFLGFVTPVVPDHNITGVSLPPVETDPVIYKLWKNGNPGDEYFVIENRQKILFDTYLPGSGLLIYHVDDGVWNNNHQWLPPCIPGAPHYHVAVEQADGLWELEQNIGYGDNGDPYPGNTQNNSFDDLSTPDSRDYDCNSTDVAVKNISPSGDSIICDIEVLQYLSGDANGDGVVNTADLSYLANYLYFNGPEPQPLLAGDANGDCGINSSDLSYLANYIFFGGPEPQYCSKR
jgi:immune inhibitor A